MIFKKDYLIISIIGFFCGLLLLPILSNIRLAFFEISVESVFLLIFGIIIIANGALWIASLLGRIFPVFLQFAKFVAVGGLNTLLDLGFLNFLMMISGFFGGFQYPIFKGASFIIANMNSYFWNKYWTFGSGGKTNIKELGQFLTVSLFGFGINISIAYFVVEIIGAPENISLERWANVGALLATAISLIWNFVGYKFFVFSAKSGVASDKK